MEQANTMVVEGYLNGKDTILRKRKLDNTYVEIPKLKFYSTEHEIERLLGYDYSTLTWQVLKDLMGIGTQYKPKLKLTVVPDGKPYKDKLGVEHQNLKIVSYEKLQPVNTNAAPQNPGTIAF